RMHGSQIRRVTRQSHGPVVQNWTMTFASRFGDWRSAGDSLAQSLATAIQNAVLDGQIPVRRPLPSERAPARDMDVSPGTVGAGPSRVWRGCATLAGPSPGAAGGASSACRPASPPVLRRGRWTTAKATLIST